MKRASRESALRFYPLEVPMPARSTIKRHYMNLRQNEGPPIRCDEPDCPFHAGPLVWRGRPLPLELDHCDGAARNNRAKNLRLLCPICHRQQPTHGGRNAGATDYTTGGYARRRCDGTLHHRLMADPGSFEVRTLPGGGK